MRGDSSAVRSAPSDGMTYSTRIDRPVAIAARSSTVGLPHHGAAWAAEANAATSAPVAMSTATARNVTRITATPSS